MDESAWKDASKIWSMLDEMSEKDPRAYKKFIDKQLEEGRKMMTPPEPDFVIQSSFKNRLDCLYINVCSWVRITEPKTDDDPINFFSTEIYHLDDDKSSDQIISIAAAPGIIQRYGKKGKLKEERDGFVMLIFEFLRVIKNIEVSETWNVVNCLDLKGTPQQLYEQMKFDPTSMGGQMEDIAQTFVPKDTIDSSSLLNKVNDFILKKESSGEDAASYANSQKDAMLLNKSSDNITISQTAKPKKVLIEEMPFEFPHEVSTIEDAKLGRSYLINITLENVTSVKDCDLVISKTDMRLKAKASSGSLALKFAEPVDDTRARAQFKKKAGLLHITVPALVQ